MIAAVVDALVLDGRVTLLALAVLGLELVVLLVVARRRLGFLPILANSFSGVFLILALRAAIVDSGGAMILVWLTGGFIAHVADLAFRLRRWRK